jgi:DNA-binding NarL/FixJ family response regulator
MATPADHRARYNGAAPPGRDDGDRDLALLAAELAAVLEHALLAARRLQRALGGSGGGCGERAAHPADASCPSAGIPPGRCGLSRREAEVLGLLAAGQSNREIARALCLSPRTVQRHVANLYPKIGAHNRAEATAFALHNGLR